MSRNVGISLLAALALITALTLYLRQFHQAPTPPPQPEPTSESQQIPPTPPEPKRAEGIPSTAIPQQTNHPAPLTASGAPAISETPQQQAFKDFLDKMSRHSELLHKEFNLLEQLSALHASENENTNHLVFAKMRETFQELGRTATTNDDALQLLVDASQSKYLQGVAVAGIGLAAENGNQRAIYLLLEPAKNGWLLSSSASALVKVAQSGNEQAIAFMCQLTQDQANRALWGFATTALAGPAESGNEQAIAGLVNISATTPPPIRRQVIEALKAAAANGSQSAATALKQMSDSNQDVQR